MNNKPNALEMNIADLLEIIKRGETPHIEKPKKKKAAKAKPKPGRDKSGKPLRILEEEVKESAREIAERITRWERNLIPDALVMNIEFCHCVNCHHEWRQMKYGDLMIRYRERRGKVLTYRPIEVCKDVNPEELPKIIQISARETLYCTSCFISQAVIEGLSEGRPTQIIRGSDQQLDLFIKPEEKDEQAKVQRDEAQGLVERAGV